jgi:hypothetical protein
MSDVLQNGGYVATLQQLMADGGFAIRELPEYIKTLLDKGIWRDRIVKQTGRRAQFENFQQFVESPLVDGLGASIEQIRSLCREDTESIDLIDRELQRPPGGDKRSKEATSVNNVNVDRPQGNASATALRRLRKDRSDLHAKVIAGELSAHSAMIEAGFRPKTITVPVDPQRAARAIQRHFTQDEVIEICALLTGAIQ